MRISASEPVGNASKDGRMSYRMCGWYALHVGRELGRGGLGGRVVDEGEV